MVSTRFFVRYFVFLNLVIGFGCVSAAVPLTPAVASDDEERRASYGFGGGYWGGMDRRYMSKQMQNAEAVNSMINAINRLERSIGKELTLEEAGAKRQAQDAALRNLYKELQLANSQSAKLGTAIVKGLGGVAYDDPVDGIVEGATIGAALRASKAVGEVMSKRIEGSIDHVLGGAWDFIVGGLIDLWKTGQQVMFHGGAEPFTIKELRGWQALTESSFTDVERLVRDGVRESLRGNDMTLRKVDDADAVQLPVRTSVWRLLIGGYVRQIDYFVALIDKRIEYYDKEEVVVFWASEVKNRLLEFAAVLQECVTLKDLDAALDSSKNLIPALKKNVSNVMARLIEQVEPKSYALIKEGGSVVREAPRRETGGGMGPDAFHQQELLAV